MNIKKQIENTVRAHNLRLRFDRTQSHKRGDQTEKRFFSLFENGIPPTLPQWVLRVERATETQDILKGIDVVVWITNFFEENKPPLQIFLQIKSSEAMAIKFQRKRHSTHVGLLVIDRQIKDWELLDKIKAVLKSERKWLFQKRRHHEHMELPE